MQPMVMAMDELEKIINDGSTPVKKRRVKVTDEAELVRLTPDIQQQTVKVIKEALDASSKDIKELEKQLDKKGVSRRAVVEAFNHFEDAVGGRERLIEILGNCPPNTIGAAGINRLLNDPAFLTKTSNGDLKYSLWTLCSKGKVPFSMLVAAFKDSKQAQLAVSALMQASKHVPEVVEQMASDSKNRWEECKMCDGKGRLHRLNDQMEFMYDDFGEAITQLCMGCRGKGREYVKHDVANRKMLLKMAGVIEEGPLVQNNLTTTNQTAHVTNYVPGDGGFEKLMRAMDSVLAGHEPKQIGAGDAILEAEIIHYDEGEDVQP